MSKSQSTSETSQIWVSQEDEMPSHGRQVPGLPNMQNRIPNSTTVGGPPDHSAAQTSQEESGKVRGLGLPLRVNSMLSINSSPRKGCVWHTAVHAGSSTSTADRIENRHGFAVQQGRFYMSFSAGGRSTAMGLLLTKTPMVRGEAVGDVQLCTCVIVLDIL